MTDVTLTEFSFALPTIVCFEDGANENLVSSTEFPHEFFGLAPIDQVAVINGVLCAVVRLAKNGSDMGTNDERGPGTSIFPLHFGIGVTVRRSSKLFIEAHFSFPEIWKSMNESEQGRVLDSVALLLQTAAISIVNRESRKEESHE